MAGRSGGLSWEAGEKAEVGCMASSSCTAHFLGGAKHMEAGNSVPPPRNAHGRNSNLSWSSRRTSKGGFQALQECFYRDKGGFGGGGVTHLGRFMACTSSSNCLGLDAMEGNRVSKGVPRRVHGRQLGRSFGATGAGGLPAQGEAMSCELLTHH